MFQTVSDDSRGKSGPEGLKSSNLEGTWRRVCVCVGKWRQRPLGTRKCLRNIYSCGVCGFTVVSSVEKTRRMNSTGVKLKLQQMLLQPTIISTLGANSKRKLVRRREIRICVREKRRPAPPEPQRVSSESESHPERFHRNIRMLVPTFRLFQAATCIHTLPESGFSGAAAAPHRSASLTRFLLAADVGVLGEATT